MLEKSCNLKLAAKRQECMEEMETEIKLTGFKMQQRVQRVINKLFEGEVEFEDIFMDRAENSEDERNNRPTQNVILKKAMENVDNLCKLTKDITEKTDEVPLADQCESSDDELPWKEGRR